MTDQKTPQPDPKVLTPQQILGKKQELAEMMPDRNGNTLFGAAPDGQQ